MSARRPMVIFGAAGQVGSEMREAAVRSGRETRAFDRARCDITDIDALRAAIPELAIVVNCAAYTQVDKAESEPQAAARINTDAAGLIAAVCAEHEAAMIQLSTDYVFDGSGATPWRETDPIAPVSVYGRTKADGEAAVRRALSAHVVLRTSWVFGARGGNFVKTMRRLAASRDHIGVVADQRGGPTPATAIAQAALRISDAIEADMPDAFGTYHFSGAPAVSWHEFAAAVLADLPHVTVAPIATVDYPTPARRPLNSVLDCGLIARKFGIGQPDWRPALGAVLGAL